MDVLLLDLHVAKTAEAETAALNALRTWLGARRLPAVTKYLETTYLGTPDLRAHWVHRYGIEGGFAGRRHDTNNPVESVFRTSKVDKLKYKGNMRIDQLCEFILFTLVPHFTTVLLEGAAIGASVDLSRLYKDADRLDEWATAIASSHIQLLSREEGLYSVMSSRSNSLYNVSLRHLSCSCRCLRRAARE
jgi:hypothetical protein